MSASGGWTQLAVRLPIAIMHRGLRTLGWRSFEGVTLCIQRLRARIRHRDFYLLPFHRAPTVRLRTPRTSVVAPIVHASSATMDPQGQPLFVESVAQFVRSIFFIFFHNRSISISVFIWNIIYFYFLNN